MKAKKYVSEKKGVHYADEKKHIVVTHLKTKAKFSMNNIYFEYKLTIMTKDSKYRILINDVHCIEKKYKNMPASTQYIGDQYNLDKDLFSLLMRDLRNKLNDVVEDINKNMKLPKEEYSDW